MTLFEQLSKNKGTLSSALGKALAADVLEAGRTDILLECIDLASYERDERKSRHIRAGAAKVVEIVAEAQPAQVAPHLAKLLPALAVAEPQTRWMIIRVMGFCAALNKPVALKAIPFAAQYIAAKDGLVLASSADLFLGDLGALSTKDAQKIFPLLEESMATAITNEQDWLLEAGLKVFANLAPAEQAALRAFAERWQYSPRKSTQQRVKRLLRLSERK
jgi:hypothetical protein